MNVQNRGFRLTLDALLDYSDNCRALLKDTLLAHRDLVDRPIQPPLREMRSIRYIASHMVGAEQRWVERRILGRDISDYETCAATSIDDLFVDWDRTRSQTRAYLAKLNPDDYRRVYTVGLGERWIGSLTVEQILFHIFNHETHHRAQISMALQQFGLDPPDFDFVFLK